MSAVQVGDPGAAEAGLLFILSAPSGGGKTTLRKVLLGRYPDIRYSVSYTTRKSREDETDGVDYHFITGAEFRKRQDKGLWAEWAEVHGNFYATSAEFIEGTLAAGHDILLDLDVQGTFQISKRYPASVLIFLMPPSMEVLKKRLEDRGTDTGPEIAKRLARAREEIAKKDFYHHVIVNDELSVATGELAAVIEEHRSRRV